MPGDEALVVQAFCEWLHAEGWTTRTEQMHVDIVAERDGEHLYVEAKGHTTSPGLDVDTGFGQLLRRMPAAHDAAMRFALVVRDEPRSVRAATRVAQRVLDLLGIRVYAVGSDGDVRELSGG